MVVLAGGVTAAEVLDGGATNERFCGRGSDDTLKGGIGTELLSGSTDADELIGGLSGNDEAYGAGGNDVVDDTSIDTLVANPALSCEHTFVNGVPLPDA